MIKLIDILLESKASEEAKRQGLTHTSFGRYADKSGKVVAMSRNGKLVKIEDDSPKKSHTNKKEHIMFDKALDIATKAHQGQVDKGGHDYIGHPTRVANSFDKDDPARVVAVLHDVVEDTPVTMDDLRKHFPSHIVAGVDAMTRRKDEGETFFDYIRRVAKDDIGRRVKIADITDNSDLTRVQHDPETLKMITGMIKSRYIKALAILRDGGK